VFNTVRVVYWYQPWLDQQLHRKNRKCSESLSQRRLKSDSRKLDIWRGPSKGAVPSSLLCWRKHTINPTGRFLCLTVNCQRERNLEQFSVKEQKISAVQICLFLSIFGLFTRFLLPAEAGRNLWVALLQPVPQQGHPEQGAQGHVQAALGDTQGGDPTPLGSLRQCSIIAQHGRAPGVQREPPVLQFVPMVSGPGNTHHWQSLAAASDTFTQGFMGADEILLSLLFSSRAVIALSTSPHGRGASGPFPSWCPFIGLNAECSCWLLDELDFPCPSKYHVNIQSRELASCSATGAARQITLSTSLEKNSALQPEEHCHSISYVVIFYYINGSWLYFVLVVLMYCETVPREKRNWIYNGVSKTYNWNLSEVNRQP